jgi:alpha-glucosidase (family GH31 glycosyl hydrolase)
VIPIGIGLGLTGFPYYAFDVGGYTSQAVPPSTEELWYRWVTMGALSPVMRTHHGRAELANWSWERDAAATAHFARWARWHIRLFPYLYAMAARAAELGDPMFRPLAYDHPDFEPGWTSVDTYALGDRIVVAPVVVEGATSRSVTLPAGDWYPLFGGASVSGTIEAIADESTIPAFVPAGTLLVLLPEDVDTLAPAADSADVVTLADVAHDRELLLWPGGSGTSTLVEATGDLAYAWTPATFTGPITTATWNGTPLTVPATGLLEVTGPGTLVLDATATLVVTGPAHLRIRLGTVLPN